MSELVGTVAQVSVYPVKSLAGRTVAQAEVDRGGLVGDRRWVVVDGGTGQRLRAKDLPTLADVVASGDPASDTVTLTEALGRPVRLDHGERPQTDVAPVHLVSRRAIERAAAGEVPAGCSADDPRANLLLDLADGADERAWVGRALRIGAVQLAVTRTPKHCLGVYAEVTTPGRVRVGDEVRLLGS